MTLKCRVKSVVLTASACGSVLITGVLAAPPAAARDVPPGTCVYKVTGVTDFIPVRQGPAESYPSVDKLGPYDHTIGSCRRYGEKGRWRNVLGLYRTKIGFAEAYLLKRLGTAEEFGL